MVTILPPVEGDYNLKNYDSIRERFEWQDINHYLYSTSDGKINVAYETIDRHVIEGYGNKIALHYIDQSQHVTLTFKQIQGQVNSYAKKLKENGVEKGDRVFILLPKNPSCYVAILAAIKIGAIAAPLFEGFMEDAIHDRIDDAKGKVLITDRALAKRVNQSKLPLLEVILYQETLDQLPVEKEKPSYIEWVDPEDGLLLHYTSGSTGKPKGVLHAHRSVSHHLQTGKWVLDIKDNDVYWCTSHPGWVTGSVYGLFAPWLNRATIVIQGGRFKAENWYSLIESLQVTIWYSAPTAFRMLMAERDLHKQYDLSSLRHVLSVGEPLNPEVIQWAWNHLNVRIHDTWWMTETGGHIIVNLPNERIKLGSMGRPLPGIDVAILDNKGRQLPAGEVGHLAIKAPWPGLMKEIWGNKNKFDTYFQHGRWYISGDLAYQDSENYVFFQGRNDDMINSSGERIGPFEVESSLIEHEAIAEAGVIGKPDPIRGEVVKAFITLRPGFEPSQQLVEEIRLFVRGKLAAHAAPREIEIVTELPKTKISGKILRRELKQQVLERSLKNLIL